jgi:hypothetical protein
LVFRGQEGYLASTAEACYLALSKLGGTPLILSDDFVAVWYHTPIVTLDGGNNSELLHVTVDADFGENVQEYVLAHRMFEWVAPTY